MQQEENLLFNVIWAVANQFTEKSKWGIVKKISRPLYIFFHPIAFINFLPPSCRRHLKAEVLHLPNTV